METTSLFFAPPSSIINLIDRENRLWRKRHQWRLFKAKMVLFANYPYPHFIDDEGNCIQHPHWFELAKQRWNYHYKSMSLLSENPEVVTEPNA